MEQKRLDLKTFEPEVYCLRCQYMQWNDEQRQCDNFEKAQCPLIIRSLLAGFEVSCLVV